MNTIEKQFTYNHTAKIAVFLLDKNISQEDLLALSQYAYSNNDITAIDDGYIIWVGEEPTREGWRYFSDNFFELVLWCAEQQYEWLRFCP